MPFPEPALPHPASNPPVLLYAIASILFSGISLACMWAGQLPRFILDEAPVLASTIFLVVYLAFCFITYFLWPKMPLLVAGLLGFVAAYASCGVFISLFQVYRNGMSAMMNRDTLAMVLVMPAMMASEPMTFLPPILLSSIGLWLARTHGEKELD